MLIQTTENSSSKGIKTRLVVDGAPVAELVRKLRLVAQGNIGVGRLAVNQKISNQSFRPPVDIVKPGKDRWFRSTLRITRIRVV